MGVGGGRLLRRRQRPGDHPAAGADGGRGRYGPPPSSATPSPTPPRGGSTPRRLHVMPAGDAPDVFSGVEERVPEALADHLRGIQLIDHHVHGAFNKPVDRAGFEASINEGSTDPVPDFMTMFDSPLGLVDPALVRTGFGVARACARRRLLGTPKRTRPRRADHRDADAGRCLALGGGHRFQG